MDAAVTVYINHTSPSDQEGDMVTFAIQVRLSRDVGNVLSMAEAHCSYDHLGRRPIYDHLGHITYDPGNDNDDDDVTLLIEDYGLYHHHTPMENHRALNYYGVRAGHLLHFW
eukprot:10367503-Heterocapsa_arctica.AAC.1